MSVFEWIKSNGRSSGVERSEIIEEIIPKSCKSRRQLSPEHKSEIDAGTEREIGLTGGHVQKAVGPQYDMHLAGECVFHAYVGTHGHKGIFAVRSGAVVKNEVGCGGIEHGLHRVDNSYG